MNVQTYNGLLLYCDLSSDQCTHTLQVRGALVAAFGADATAKLGPLLQKWDDAVSAAGGVEALANKVTLVRNL